MVKIPDEIIDKVKKFAALIKYELPLEKVFIFGSFAKGNYREDSDIDVCIIATHSENNFLSLLKINHKVFDVDTRIEPVVFSSDEYENESDFGVLKEVKKYGVEILI